MGSSSPKILNLGPRAVELPKSAWTSNAWMTTMKKYEYFSFISWQYPFANSLLCVEQLSMKHCKGKGHLRFRVDFRWSNNSNSALLTRSGLSSKLSSHSSWFQALGQRTADATSGRGCSLIDTHDIVSRAARAAALSTDQFMLLLTVFLSLQWRPLLSESFAALFVIAMSLPARRFQCWPNDGQTCSWKKSRIPVAEPKKLLWRRQKIYVKPYSTRRVHIWLYRQLISNVQHNKCGCLVGG